MACRASSSSERLCAASVLRGGEGEDEDELAPAPPPPPPPLWEATWTYRSGPLAKSRLQAASGPLVAGPLRPSRRCRARRPSARGAGPGHWEKRRDRRGRLEGAGESERAAAARAGSSPRGRELAPREPRGRRIAKPERRGPRSRKVPRGRRRPRGSRPAAARRRGTRAGKFSKPRKRGLAPRSCLARAAPLGALGSPTATRGGGPHEPAGARQVAPFRDPEARCLN